jgi:hypothetical protein
MKRALQISLLAITIFSCSSSKLYYSSDAQEWNGKTPEDKNELICEIKKNAFLNLEKVELRFFIS